MKILRPQCFCSIVPPHIFDQMGKSGNAAYQATAKASEQLTARLRGQRDILGLMPMMSVAPGVKRRTIYTAGNTQGLPGTIVRTEGAPATNDVSVDQAYDGGGIVWDFYKEVFDRDSTDNRGARLDSTVHFGAGFDNAFWNGNQMVYGDGDGTIMHNFASAIDVIGHELTHGVTQSESQLAYQGESGALNESLSDVFGSLVKQYHLKQTAAQADWLIGVGVLMDPGARAIRDMLHPGTAYAIPNFGADPQPATYEKRYTGTDDNGGVHINSGIPNCAFAKFAIALDGNAWNVPGHIWYQTATASGLPSSATFAQFRDLTVKVAGQLDPATLQPPTTVASVVVVLENAWQTVGL